MVWGTGFTHTRACPSPSRAKMPCDYALSLSFFFCKWNYDADFRCPAVPVSHAGVVVSEPGDAPWEPRGGGEGWVQIKERYPETPLCSTRTWGSRQPPPHRHPK